MKKVVVIGPESTGKSTLCEMLAVEFNTLWCPEYAREYLLANGTHYSFDDLLTIAKGQLALEEKYLQKVKNAQAASLCGDLPIKGLTGHHKVENAPPAFLFVDTDQYVMKVWCEYVFGDCHNWILRQIAKSSSDLYLLCKPDLPWEKDDLREYPDEKPRQELYHIYRDLLINQHINWAEISGGYKERFDKAREAVNMIC